MNIPQLNKTLTYCACEHACIEYVYIMGSYEQLNTRFLKKETKHTKTKEVMNGEIERHKTPNTLSL